MALPDQIKVSPPKRKLDEMRTRVLPSLVSVQVFPRGQEHRLRLPSTAFRTCLWTKTEIERGREGEGGKGGEFGDRRAIRRRVSPSNVPQLAFHRCSFTALSSGIPATKRMEGKVPYLSILILGLVFASQEGKGMGGIPRVVDSTVGVLAAKLEILTCEF